MMQDITQTVYTQGMLAGNWTGQYSTQHLMLSFSHTLDPTIPYPDYNYIGTGCYRGADWPWYIQGIKWQWTLPLIPLFTFLLALWNLQAFRKNQDYKHVAIQVVLGCASYLGESLSLLMVSASLPCLGGSISSLSTPVCILRKKKNQCPILTYSHLKKKIRESALFKKKIS